MKTESRASEVPRELDNDVTWYGRLAEAERLIFYILKRNSIYFDFDPMIEELNRENYVREAKTWEFVRCLVCPK